MDMSNLCGLVEFFSVFTLESGMKEPVSDWMNRKGLHVVEELATGWGICDLVGCAFNPDKIVRRTEQRQRQPLGSSEAIHIYSLLPDSHRTRVGIKLSVLSDQLYPYIDQDRIEVILEKLIRSNHVRVTGTGTFQKINGWAPMYSQLIAVELKLKRIEDVFAQARSNLAFAPESYVALPYDIAIRVAESVELRHLTNSGIGLLAVSSCSCDCFIEASTTSEMYDESLSLWAVEHFWKVHRSKH